MADRIADAWRVILQELGADPNDPHLAESPDRVAKALRGWSTYDVPLPKMTVFPATTRGVVEVRDLRFYALCAHHGLPFTGVVHVAYRPHETIIGLSKIARLVQHFAGRFQVQERFTSEIRAGLSSVLHPMGVAVAVHAEHLCLSMRGVRQPGHRTVTLESTGDLGDFNPETLR